VKSSIPSCGLHILGKDRAPDAGLAGRGMARPGKARRVWARRGEARGRRTTHKEALLRSYDVTLTGKMPLLMHADNIDWADQMGIWKDDPRNKKTSKAGDDRTPAFRWLGSLYHDGAVVAIPNDNLMRAFMEGGAMVPVPGARNQKTFKSQSQSGMLVDGSHWPLTINGTTIPVAPILDLKDEPNFQAHRKAVAAMGFELFLKRAKIGQSKHIRVRPMFEKWAVSGVVHVWDEQITADALTQIVTFAGLYRGLGDWRPGGKTPGPFGMFAAKVTAA
jgi:hypothetical protein